MKFLKSFENHTGYETFTQSDGFIKPNVSRCIEENEVHYNPYIHDYSQDYFTIESLEDNNTIYLKASNSAVTKTVSISTDNGETWTEYASSTGDSGTTLAMLNKGDKLLVKGENSAYATSSYYNQFQSTKQFEVKGNIMSLVSGDSFANADELTGTYTFYRLFFQCTGLTSAENIVLPATTLVYGCYEGMFRKCTSLTTVPELPATTLANYCYSFMFCECTSLTTAPELPATALTDFCYLSMFSECTNLTTAPELPAETLVFYCYYHMFSNCINLTTITSIGANNGNINGTNNIFEGCNKLNYVVFASNNSINDNMFLNLGTFGTDSVPGTLVLNTVSLYNDNNFLIQFCNKNWRIILNGNDMGINNACSGGGSGSGSWGSGS